MLNPSVLVILKYVGITALVTGVFSFVYFAGKQSGYEDREDQVVELRSSLEVCANQLLSQNQAITEMESETVEKTEAREELKKENEPVKIVYRDRIKYVEKEVPVVQDQCLAAEQAFREELKMERGL